MSNTEKPVAVIGGGLVGSLQALFLANRGFHVELYESRQDIRKSNLGQGRSINLALSHRGREALKAVGCEKEVVDMSIPMYGRMIHSLNGEMSPQLYSTKGDAILSIDRQKLNEYILDKADAHPNIKVYFEHKLVRANLKDQILTLNYVGREKDISVSFTFGCDGAYSTVRRQLMRWERLNYSQEYIEHGYKELTMPPTEEGDYAMPANYLHIWPKQEFMMIALPNLDKSFTMTLFMPYKVFNSIETEEDVLTFFMKHFPDSIDKIGANRLVKDFFNNPTGSLVSIKCFPHYLDSHTVILGDAAHAVVPFYGQGMNAGMEDCLVFDECLEQVGGDLHKGAQTYSAAHWKDCHAIADLSMYNYLEMRSHVTSRLFLFRKVIDNFLHFLFPQMFIPLYPMVAFSRLPYHKVKEKQQQQQVIIRRGMFLVGLGVMGVLGYSIFRFTKVKLPPIVVSIGSYSWCIF